MNTIAFGATMFSTKSCIRKMTLIHRTPLSTGNTTTNILKSYSYISQRRPSKIMYTTLPLQEISPVIDHLPFTNEYQLQSLAQKIKKMIMSKSRDYDGQVEELIMIDAIQRLGLEYHFENDINRLLENHYEQFMLMCEDCCNLHDVALRFRLLRQAGYNVSADVFNKFKDKDGGFKKELQGDISGLLNLFEASQLSIAGDQLLDDAGEMCKNLLKSITENAKAQPGAKLIEKTLNSPYYKSLPRLSPELNNFESSLKILHDYRGMTNWINDIQEMARIDANEAKITHKSEVIQVSRWWKELGLTENLKLARSAPEKWHMWSLVVLPGPTMAELRTELTKAISFMYIIDDIYDVYGTLEELTLFTEAVNRWDYTNLEGLPDYMKLCLKALYDTTNETCSKLYIEHGWNPIDHLQKAWADLCNDFLVEARWFASGHLPTSEEYLKNGIASSGVYVVSENVLCLLGEAVNYRSINQQNSESEFVTSAARFHRLWDDLRTSKDENQDGNDGSFIACYMNQYEDSSAESAKEYVLQMISDSWKCLNKECLFNSSFSANFKLAILNLARMVPIMYSNDENHQRLEKYMKSLLHE